MSEWRTLGEEGAFVQVLGEAAAVQALENERLRDALRAIADNAESWHGPAGDRGHERALAVIASTAREALRDDEA